MFALDLFNTDHERRLTEGAVDQLEQRRIDDLAMKMDDLVARAKTATTPEVKQALMKEFQKCKAERDNYYKIQDECMGYGSLVGEETHEFKGAHGRLDVAHTPGKTVVRRKEYPGSDDMRADKFPNSRLKGKGTGSAVKTGSGMSGSQGTMRKMPRLDHDGNDEANYEVDEAGIPGNVPAEKIPGKEALLKGRGRSYYEAQGQKKNSKVTEDQRLSVGDPIVVTAPNEFEGKTGEVAEFSPSGKFVVVDLYNHGRHSMHLSDVEYNQYADTQADEDDWYDDADEFGKPGSEFFPEGFQDFNKVEPYAVCLAGKPVKKFDYYEDARRFHDNWKKKLYREGDKEKADKITLMPLNLEESSDRVDPILIKALNRMPDGLATHREVLNAAYDAYAMELGRMQMKSNYGTTNAYIPQLLDLYKQKHGLTFNEEQKPAGWGEFPPKQEITIVPPKKLKSGETYQDKNKYWQSQGQAPIYKTNEVKADPTGSWVVYGGGKVVKFKTHTGAKAYAEKSGGKVASSEFYADKIQKQGVAEAEQPAQVNDAWFKQGAFETYKKAAPVKYSVPGRPGTVQTLEGPVKHSAQARIITGPKGEQYPVEPEKFAQLYDDNGNGTATPKKIPKLAKLADHNGVLHTSWGDLQYTAGNDYIVRHGANDYGAVKKDIFAQTYALPQGVAEVYTPAPAKPFRNPKGFNKQGTGVGNKLADLNRKEWEEKKKKEQGVAEASYINGHVEDPESLRWKQTSMSYEQAVAKFGKNNVKQDGKNRLGQKIVMVLVPLGEQAETDYSKRRQRERDVDAGKPVSRQPKNPQTDYARKRAKEKRDLEQFGEDEVDDFVKAGGKITYGKPQKGPRRPGLSLASRHIGGGGDRMKPSRTGRAGAAIGGKPVGIKEESSTSSEAVERAVLNRIMVAHTDLLMQFGPDKVMQAAEEVAYNVGDVDEIGTSDVSAYVNQVKQILGAEA